MSIFDGGIGGAIFLVLMAMFVGLIVWYISQSNKKS